MTEDTVYEFSGDDIEGKGFFNVEPASRESKAPPPTCAPEGSWNGKVRTLEMIDFKGAAAVAVAQPGYGPGAHMHNPCTTRSHPPDPTGSLHAFYLQLGIYTVHQRHHRDRPSGGQGSPDLQ